MNTARPARGALALAAVITGCAASQGTSANTSAEAHPPRPHPSAHAIDHAFERVSPDAQRCLRAGDSVTVRGAFDGASGEFRVAQVSAPGAPYAVETCVRVAVEQAHVRPFTDANAPAEHTFALTGASAASAPTYGTIPRASTSAGNNAGTMTVGAATTPVDRIQRESDALQGCYEQACERDHTVSGQVELHLTLDASGRVTQLSSRVQTPHEDVTLMELVARCIESHVRLIAFGAQSNPGYEWTVPLTFNPGGLPVD